jgi:hypothetical protein
MNDNTRILLVNSLGVIHPIDYQRFENDDLLESLAKLRNESFDIAKSNKEMKVIVPKKTSDALRRQQMYPGVYIRKNTANSVNIRDYTDNKMVQKSKSQKSKNNECGINAYDIRTWKHNS